ncbi:DUF3892 domain-containing protein [Pseudomonas sp. DP-17]|uniref:DUF3892 domain-containing protein n=1 Tax=Pseudomonas sp. DP-17 TaxID=1580486 RepID=UPI001EFBC684|nr:DUF3892 domain-containing protein [Pseudomonas sp. DP-17]MCG8905601.1 DUF3892 domain-containing protein [Pseudomonas sp. DP-17]
MFFINGVRLDENGEHIEFVRVRKIDSAVNFIVERLFIAQLISSGVVFNARFQKKGKWYTGAKVEVFGDIYLRANPNATADDNLLSLTRV